MPISGLVITLSDTPTLAETAVDMLRRDPRIELGRRRGPCQPIVVDTTNSEEDRLLWDQLHEHEGILKVDVAFVHFDEDSQSKSDDPEPEVRAPSMEYEHTRKSSHIAMESGTCR